MSLFNSSIQEYNINQAIKLLDTYLLIQKENKNLIFSKKENRIIVFNNNVKIVLSINDFRMQFYNSSFLIYKSIVEDIEINTEFKKLRQ